MDYMTENVVVETTSKSKNVAVYTDYAKAFYGKKKNVGKEEYAHA